MQIRSVSWLVLSALLMFGAGVPDLAAKVTADRKCRSLKIKQIGKYAACRMKRDAIAAKKAEAPDYEKCDQTLAKKFAKIETKFGSACPTLDDFGELSAAAATCADDLVCRTLDAPPSSASVVVLPGVEVSDGGGRTIKLQNLSGSEVVVLCSYIGESCDFSWIDFHVTLAPIETVEWVAEQGLFDAVHAIPPIVPFTGDLVCVQVLEDVGHEPVSGNDLRISTRLPGECPEQGLGLRALGANNGDPEIRFGSEFDSCPAELDPGVVESCWSQLDTFDFSCDP